MGAKRGRPEHSFTDIHLISRFIDKRLNQLRSHEPAGEGPRIGRPDRTAILEFIQARRSEVSELRVRTFVFGYPSRPPDWVTDSWCRTGRLPLRSATPSRHGPTPGALGRLGQTASVLS